ncbi:MAG: dihydroorotate dehydrogenase electron transfer subunit [Clostridia bacterium]|nr:dihydroorotate dehydrogenase electron transfer subunit [Clostridia bacterium]
MRYLQEQCTLMYKQEIAKGVYSFTLKAPKISKLAECGQFVNVLCDPFQLRRPISIGGFDADAGILRLVFEVRGKGTDWLAACEEGEMIDLIGPLGHGFPLKASDKRAVMIGGGIGTPPLLPLCRHYGKNAVLISGFRTASAVILEDDAKAFGARTVVCTDDGSAGFHGFTTQALEEELKNGAFDVVYTCGPKIMMKKVAELAEKYNVPCYVSMEERMACGVGACLGCACKTKKPDGETAMTRVCLNGPVFEASEVDFT